MSVSFPPQDNRSATNPPRGQPRPATLRWWARAACLVAGLVGLGLLATARTLEPDSSGVGTHRQLGLRQCSSMELWGVRCPSCGMTTSWSLATRGRLVESVEASAGGFLLALLAAASGAWLIVSAARGRWATPPPEPYWMLGTTVTLIVVILLDWIRRIV